MRISLLNYEHPWRHSSVFCSATDVSVLTNFLTLAASGDKRYVTVWRPSVHIYAIFTLTLTNRAAHTHRDSPGGSMRRGQRTFRPDNKKDRHTCIKQWQIGILLLAKPSISSRQAEWQVASCQWYSPLCRLCSRVQWPSSGLQHVNTSITA